MKQKRFTKYLLKKRSGNSPIMDKEEVVENPDNKIDQDFPGFPHAPAKEEWINPSSAKEKKEIGLDKNPKNNSGSTIASTSKGKSQ